MRFISGCGEQFVGKMQEFPTRFANEFLSSKLLTICVINDFDAIAACGILSLSNYVVYYVKEPYRGQGLGARIIAKAIDEAKKQGLMFLHSSVSTSNIPSFRLQRRFFRKIVHLEKRDYMITLLPLTLRGELLYTFLHLTCSRLPETFIGSTLDILMRIAGWIR